MDRFRLTAAQTMKLWRAQSCSDEARDLCGQYVRRGPGARPSLLLLAYTQDEGGPANEAGSSSKLAPSAEGAVETGQRRAVVGLASPEAGSEMAKPFFGSKSMGSMAGGSQGRDGQDCISARWRNGRRQVSTSTDGAARIANDPCHFFYFFRNGGCEIGYVTDDDVGLGDGARGTMGSYCRTIGPDRGPDGLGPLSVEQWLQPYAECRDCV